MKNTCILCGKVGSELILNDLPMYHCGACDLLWRKEFDVPIEHYEDKKMNFFEEKIQRRISNSFDRIRLFKKYIDLNNLCDIGCGEGVFLQALKESGYKNIIGIEPCDTAKNYAQKHDLTIFKGTIESSGQVLKDRQINSISMFHLIEHLHNPLSAVEQLLSLLPDGGSLIIETPNVHCFSFEKAKHKHKLIYKEHLFYFSEKSIRLLLEKAGYIVVALGRRDFDINQMPIHQLLQRIWFTKSQNFGVEKNEGILVSETTSSSKHETFIKDYIKETVRWILVKIVVILGRVDYIWCIAKKNIN